MSHPFWHNFVHAICLTIAATEQQSGTRTWHKNFGSFRYTPRTLRSSSPAACEWPSRMASHRRFLKSQLGSWQQAFVKPRPQPHLHRGSAPWASWLSALSKRGVLLSSVYISVHSRGHAMLQCLPDSCSVPTPFLLATPTFRMQLRARPCWESRSR